MSVKLRKRKNSDGTTSLLLDIYVNGKRTYEFIKECKLVKPSSPIDRQDNKHKLEVAQNYATKRALQIAEGMYDVKRKKEVSVFDWMEEFSKSYQKKDKRNVNGVISRFKEFRRDKDLMMNELTEMMVSNFRDYLAKKSSGEGAASYFARFKKIIKWGYKQGLMHKNPCEDIKAPKGRAIVKDVLTVAEIQKIAETDCQNEQVKNAFIFCCLTGLRWVDVVSLKWRHIKGNSLKFRQIKTQEDISVTLNVSALSILKKTLRLGDNVFKLPTQDGANKTLNALVGRAKIEKKITWHCARHSFGTNLIFYGNDIFTASKLMGHASVKHTQRYLRAAEELKKKAVDSITINI